MPGVRKIEFDAGRQKKLAGGEDGILLLAVLFMLLVLTLALATAAPKMATQLRRANELEAAHRGEQYERAIGLYYRKFGHYPTSIKQLENTDGIRFLRRRYTDPFTGKDDWVLIHPGQAEMVGAPGAAIPGSTPAADMPGAASVAGGSAIGGSGFSGGNATMFQSSGPTNAAGPMGGTIGGGGVGGSAAGQNSALNLGSSASGSGENDSFDEAGAGIGAGPIIGVGLPMKEKSFKLLNGKQASYNKWQFVFDPEKDMLQAAGVLNGAGNQTGVAPGQGINGSMSGSASGSGFGSNQPSNSFGGSSGFGGSMNSGFGSNSGFGNSGFSSGGSSTSPQQPQAPSQPQPPAENDGFGGQGFGNP